MEAPGPPSYVVALTRLQGTMESALEGLAAAVGLTPYDLRLRLAGSLPSLLERTTDLDRARGLLAALRQAGHGAVACDVRAVSASETLPRLRGFALTPAALELIEPQGARHALRFAELTAVVRALHVLEGEEHEKTTRRKVALGRAVMTGGLMFTQRVTKETHAQTDEREQVAYVYASGLQQPWLLRERELHYEGLGAGRPATAAASFAALLAMLAERAPAALHDDRFFRQRRREPDVRVTGNTAASRTTSSNVAATDLAVHLLVLAHARGLT